MAVRKKKKMYCVMDSKKSCFVMGIVLAVPREVMLMVIHIDRISWQWDTVISQHLPLIDTIR